MSQAGSSFARMRPSMTVVAGILAWFGREIARYVRKELAASPERQAITIGLGILSLTFLPVSNLLFPIGTGMAERLLYLPSAGFVVALVAAAASLSATTIPSVL